MSHTIETDELGKATEKDYEAENLKAPTKTRTVGHAGQRTKCKTINCPSYQDPILLILLLADSLLNFSNSLSGMETFFVGGLLHKFLFGTLELPTLKQTLSHFLL